MIIIPIMAFLCRAAGAHWNKVRQWAETCFALGFALAGARLGFGVAALALVWTYLMFQTGHGNFYAMKGVNPLNDDPEKLETVARPIANKLRIDIYHPAYSWLCMGLKGLAIGLFAFPFGLLLAFLWPVSYYIGMRRLGDGAYAEVMAGAFAGTIVWLSL